MLKFGYFPPFEMEEFKTRTNNVTKILWCGRMIDWKQGQHIILMANKLRELGLDFSIDMIGNGDMKMKYRKLIDRFKLNSIVRLCPPIKQKDMPYTMKRHDIFIQPSNYKEGWGAVVNEAMSCGCAVVASSGVGSSNYLIDDQVSGYIYKNGDIDSLAKIVENLVSDRALCANIGKAAQNRIQTLWNGEIAAARLLRIFEDVSNKKPISYEEDGPCSFAKVFKNI